MRRAGPKWTYSNQQTLAVNANAGTPIGGGLIADFAWLLPPARAQFLMNTKQRDRMQFSGAHLWLDFFWANNGAATGLPDVNFGCYKTTIAQTGDLPDFSPMFAQWTQPSTPATLTSWDEDDDDGSNPFLWQHYIKGLTPKNSVVSVDHNGGTFGQTSNQAAQIDTGTDDAQTYICRKDLVTQEWQPDVVIRSKRSIRKGEGIVLVMAVQSPSAQVTSRLQMHYRTLSK